MNGGIINSVTRLHLIVYFCWVILRCTDPWILKIQIYISICTDILTYISMYVTSFVRPRSLPFDVNNFLFIIQCTDTEMCLFIVAVFESLSARTGQCLFQTCSCIEFWMWLLQLFAFFVLVSVFCCLFYLE
jgi:hypothetical protein